MIHCKRLSILSLLVLILIPTLARAADNSSYIYPAVKTEPLRIDGTLEPAWFRTEKLSINYQIEPDEGANASQATDVYVMFTEEALYVAFDCHDTDPDSIAGRIQRRDNIDDADAVILHLDTYHDLRTGYFFIVSAGGVQADGTFNNEADQDDTWEGIWESAVRRSDSGYSVEIRIPFQGIRHGGSRPDGWGFNVYRWLERKSELDSWVPYIRSHGYRVSEWGVLKGLRDIHSSKHAELLPHVVGRWDSEDAGPWHSVNDWDNLGLDLKLVPASSWTLDLTYQPDFAQVDVDDEVINLSDYPIYLEEKRPFFLEGLSIFDGQAVRMLYTRKIADPDFGARVTGQWGPTRASLLAARNETEEGLEQAAFAGRTIHNIGRNSLIGVTSTSLSDTLFHAHTAAVNGRIRWGDENYLDLFAAAVDKFVKTHEETTEDSNGDDSSYVVLEDDYHDQPTALTTEVYLSNGIWRFGSGLNYRGKDFDVNDLGFTGYSNVIGYWAWLQKITYMPKGSWIDVCRNNLNYWQEIFPDGTHWEKGGNWNGYFRTNDNWYWGGGIGFGDGYFRYTYDVDDGDNITDFPYRHNFGPFRIEYHRWHSQWIWMNTDYRKPVAMALNLENASLRDGFRKELDGEIEWKAMPNMEIALNQTWIQIDDVSDRHDGALTDYSISRLKVRWSPTLDLSFRGTMQYVFDDVRDHNSDDERALLFNLLLAYNWTPGSWFYLVYDDARDWDVESGETLGRWDAGDRTIRMKWTWFVSLP